MSPYILENCVNFSPLLFVGFGQKPTFEKIFERRRMLRRRVRRGFSRLPAHRVGNGVGDLAHGLERSADNALHAVLSRAHRVSRAAADDKPHAHAHVEILPVHFTAILSQFYVARLLCAQMH